MAQECVRGGAMDCPFCDPPRDRVFYEDELVLGLWDAYPVSEGHALVMGQWLPKTAPDGT
jgi:diadenosine tetraphosphate (Ap4A) HIT family hydrolase